MIFCKPPFQGPMVDVAHYPDGWAPVASPDVGALFSLVLHGVASSEWRTQHAMDRHTAGHTIQHHRTEPLDITTLSGLHRTNAMDMT
ncbi:hypothetical protein ACOMHN_056888 [Nucella lapillus]